ncbi:RNA polymerase sigma factor [Gelidibacter salicanalis]|uniref:Sigma-70 family RNA polymerase sigma factor n=1 Tax=Gelidibacter salicanalis TaxID=291193 RepID=A0A934KSY3_9FLAO|nr:sigma-70 family RNA polymerase sigma factor [Gelidibacter salicanalis]MBJ7883014.1 sigma-70 family RNA polymerase sigma factor [Gelidibacter salicanalis]
MEQELLFDTDEIERLFKEHYKLLCLVSFAILKDKDSSKDVVQDFFISFWQKRKDISVKISFQAYAIRAVKNLSLKTLQKANNEQSLDKILYKQEDKTPSFIENANKYEKIWELLNQLPQSRKDIFISYVVYSQSYAEIAKLNGISVNTVKTQMKRSYAFLRSKAKESDLIFLYLFGFPTFYL